ncbi:MAG: ABC transporter ATP-binding protein [Bacteroidota bacterium]
MLDSVIKVENLSKRYRIGMVKKAETLAEQLKNAAVYPIKNFRKITQLSKFSDRNDPSVFWALKDINFEVQRGEVLGVIGHNGAGKSTLLKILSRITEPTTGQITFKGRVSALLEVGTGFHPELTGRDNVYLNGTILGMRKREIDAKFDEIIAFSGIEKHIDTPVKFYSSGMTVRLAFSVAAHLEPDILVIDEVLAVGDAEFQLKCLGKMEDMAGGGRTVLFVSHSMEAVMKLCNKCILLKNGVIQMSGSTNEVVTSYLDHNTSFVNGAVYLNRFSNNKKIFLKSVRILNAQYQNCDTYCIGEVINIEVIYENYDKKHEIFCTLHVVDQQGNDLFVSFEYLSKDWSRIAKNQGLRSIICSLEDPLLNVGFYQVWITIGSFNPDLLHMNIKDLVSFQVIEKMDSANKNGFRGKWPGLVRPRLSWQHTNTK